MKLGLIKLYVNKASVFGFRQYILDFFYQYQSAIIQLKGVVFNTIIMLFLIQQHKKVIFLLMYVQTLSTKCVLIINVVPKRILNHVIKYHNLFINALHLPE